MRVFWTALAAFLAAVPGVAGTLPQLGVRAFYDQIWYHASVSYDEFALVGQLIAQDDEMFSVLDDTGGFAVRMPDAKTFGSPAPGDVLRVCVRRDPTLSPPVRVTEVAVVGRRPLEEPAEVGPEQFQGKCPLLSFVKVRGTIFTAVRDELDSNWNWLLIKTTAQPIAAAFRESQMPLAEMRRLIDSEAVFEGIVMAFSGWRESLRGRSFYLAGRAPISVCKPATADFGKMPPYPQPDCPHRQRMAGRVIAACKDRFFIGGFRDSPVQVRPTDLGAIPRVGETVTVAGFPDTDSLRPQLSEALVRVDSTGSSNAVAGVAVDIERLFHNDLGEEKIAPDQIPNVVRIRGVVRDVILNDDQSGTFSLVSGKRSVSVDVSAIAGGMRNVTPGSTVEVTGLCVADFESTSTAVVFPRFRGYTVIPRSAADIALVARPPWWTASRLFALICVLLAVIVAVLVWNRELRIQSVRRGRELYREELAHALSEQKVEERTRLAVELHDSISQTLTGVALQIDAAKGCGAEEPSAAARFLETARAMLASCRQELRCCIWDLRSRTFEEKDMTEAVVRTIAPHLGKVRAKVRFNVPRRNFSESSAHDVLRIIRELVVNAVQHGDASEVRIAGECREGLVRFSVTDDGRGFDPATAPGPREGHFGLQGIRERLRGYRGLLKIESGRGKGTRTLVTFQTNKGQAL